MTVGQELWFGLFTNADAEVRKRFTISANAFESLLLESLGRSHSSFRKYREECGISVPATLLISSDSHVAISGFLLMSAASSEEISEYAGVLDVGLKKVTQKHAVAGMPSFSTDWKLLLGAAEGVKVASANGCAGDWQQHREYILKAVASLAQSDVETAIMVGFIRRMLGEIPGTVAIGKVAAELSTSELIGLVWAHHVRLSVGVPEAGVWRTLQERISSDFHLEQLAALDLALLLIVLKDNWASGWEARGRNNVDFVKAALNAFLACARRDIKAGLIRNEADVQRIIWSMLRPSFPDLVDEEFLSRFGAKNFKPDFGIPSLRLLIEAKHVKGSKTVGQIQDELQADVIGYKESKSDYESVLFFIYDTKGEVAANTEMQRVIRELPGVGDVIVVAGPAASEE